MTNGNSEINVIMHPVSGEVENAGLTKREYFAAMAMQGLLAGAGKDLPYADFAEQAVNCADAIIEQLNKQL